MYWTEQSSESIAYRQRTLLPFRIRRSRLCTKTFASGHTGKDARSRSCGSSRRLLQRPCVPTRDSGDRDAGPDDPRLRLGCRQIDDRCRSLPGVRQSRVRSTAFQAAEHVEQCRGHRRCTRSTLREDYLSGGSSNLRLAKPSLCYGRCLSIMPRLARHSEALWHQARSG